jgi:hypothetical protein
MAGQLTAGAVVSDSLKTSSGVFATNNAITGISQAWVNFNGVTSITVRSSYNVSSVTRNALGDYTINLTTALADANGSVIIGQSYLNTRGDAATNHASIAGGYMASSSSVNVQTAINSASAYYDVTTCSVAVFR